jgi:hypothetical protein
MGMPMSAIGIGGAIHEHAAGREEHCRQYARF